MHATQPTTLVPMDHLFAPSPVTVSAPPCATVRTDRRPTTGGRTHDSAPAPWLYKPYIAYVLHNAWL